MVVIVALVALSVTTASVDAIRYDPTPYPESVIIANSHARFTMLTERVIRMEYSHEPNAFEDRATLAIVNRRVEVPTFDVNTTDDVLTIESDYFNLTYTGGPFTADSLVVHGILGKSNQSKELRFGGTWRPGMANSGALPGAIKSLDLIDPLDLNCTSIDMMNITVHDESLHCESGIMSRSGWRLYDDTDTPCMKADGIEWDLENPSADATDWYLFLHGLDYFGALQDFTAIAGRIHLPPKYSLGAWYTRWFNFNTKDMMQVVHNFEMYSLPLDVMVFDMNWHTKDGSPDGWTGYTWDQRLFPSPHVLTTWLKSSKGLALGANLHDFEGVGVNEHRYPTCATKLGMDDGMTIPFSVTNATISLTVEDVIVKPLNNPPNAPGVGFDFMWIDYQQGGHGGGAPGGKANPTFYLNHLRFNDNKRWNQDKRPMILGRWGGMGSHRYPVGFSGDPGIFQNVTDLSWKTLAYQPYFSWSGSNVGFGMWSHDILGKATDPELSLRWMQFGAFSGVLRLHDRGLSSGHDCQGPFTTRGQLGFCAIVDPWKQPYNIFEAMRGVMQLRASLLPYIYNNAVTAYQTGLSLIRPMYYAYPEQDMAYAGDMHGNFSQYMFGDRIMVAPIVGPAGSDHPVTEKFLSYKEIWVPPGGWVERYTGSRHYTTLKEGRVIQRYFDLTEIPMFAKEDEFIPFTFDPHKVASHFEDYNSIGSAGKRYANLAFEMYSSFSSEKESSYVLYEDDGATTEYERGGYSTTTVFHQHNLTTYMTHIDLIPPMIMNEDAQNAWTAGYEKPAWLPDQRRYQFKLRNSVPAIGVTVNGKALPYDPMKFNNNQLGNYYYDGEEVSVVINTGLVPIGQTLSIHVQFPALDLPAMYAQLSGCRCAIRHAQMVKQVLDEVQKTPGMYDQSKGFLIAIASLGDSVEALLAEPGNSEMSEAIEMLGSFAKQLEWAREEIINLLDLDQGRRVYAMELLNSCGAGTELYL